MKYANSLGASIAGLLSTEKNGGVSRPKKSLQFNC
ncbi:hypothetical protein ABIC74_002286 [Mucilaginibacter rubeus]